MGLAQGLVALVPAAVNAFRRSGSMRRMKGLRIVFTGREQARAESFEVPSVGPGELRIRTEVSLISIGTESTCFLRRFAPGTHFDRWVRYPFYPGYSLVGRIEEAGPGCPPSHAPGTLVATSKPHASHVVCRWEDATPVDPAIPADLAAWFALAQITFNGVRKAGIGLSDRVALVGAGPVGQMVLRWVLASGAWEVAVVDPSEERLELERRAGATHLIRSSAADAVAEMERVFSTGPGEQVSRGAETDPAPPQDRRDPRPDVAIDATGSAAVFGPILAMPRTGGKVLLMGDPGNPDDQHLTPDLLTRSLTVVGGHFMTRFPDRTWSDIHRVYFRMVLDGRIRMDGMTTRTLDPRDPQAAYRLAVDERDRVMGLVFDWSGVARDDF